MKIRTRGLVLVAFAAATVAVLAAGTPAPAQQGQGKFITEAAARLSKHIGAANGDGFKLVDDRFSIGGGWIKQGASNWVSLYTLNMTAGKTYRVIAAGDNDAKDVDVEIQDGAGKTVAKDTSTDPEAIVNFTPGTSGKYLVRVRLYASRNDLPCVCMAIVMAK
jgi:hypothetical protein